VGFFVKTSILGGLTSATNQAKPLFSGKAYLGGISISTGADALVTL